MNLRSSLIVALAVLSTACSTAKGPSLERIAPSVNATLRTGEDLEDVIEAGDLIQVRLISDEAPGVGGVVSDPSFQLNQDVRVQADGRASFIGLDSVITVSGMLPGQLSAILTGRYKIILDEEPTLSVIVAEQAPRTVTVFGEVYRPGLVTMPPNQHLSLVEALGRAGGPTTNTAWLSNTLLIRWDVEANRQHVWTIDARRRHWDTEDTVYLQNRDIVFIPNTNVDRSAININNFVRRMIPLNNIVPTFPQITE